jgi:hypothetical protein
MVFLVTFMSAIGFAAAVGNRPHEQLSIAVAIKVTANLIAETTTYQ